MLRKIDTAERPEPDAGDEGTPVSVEAADACFSPSNAEAILLLPQFVK